MANRVRGEASFTTADGRDLTLVVDFNALAHAEDAADMGVGQILASMSSKPRIRVMQAMTFGALRALHPEITMADVGDMLLSPDAGPLTGALNAAVVAAFPPPDESAEGKVQTEGGTGTPSKKTGRAKA